MKLRRVVLAAAIAAAFPFAALAQAPSPLVPLGTTSPLVPLGTTSPLVPLGTTSPPVPPGTSPPPAAKPVATNSTDGLLLRFLGNFFNGSQDIPDSVWPYSSGPSAELRKFPRRKTHHPSPMASTRSAARPRSATATSRPPIR
jgi:hypothetical protein